MATPLRLLALLCASLTTLADNVALRESLILERARAAAPQVPRTAFLARAALEAVSLSPDGRHLAYIQMLDSDREVLLQATHGGAIRRVQTHSTAHSLSWSRDGRWLLLESASELFAVPTTGSEAPRIVTTLGERANLQRSLLRVDPSVAAGVLLLERTRGSSGIAPHSRLLRVDLRGSRTLLHEDAHTLLGAALTTDGSLAWLTRVEAEHITIHQVISRPDGSPRLRELLRCERLERCTPLPLVNSTGELLLRGDVAGTLNRVARLDASGILHTVHTDPSAESDLDWLSLDPLTQQPMFAGYRSTQPALYGLTSEARHHLSKLQQRLPRRDLGVSVGRGTDAMWLIEERDSTLQVPRWHLYDPRAHTLRQVLQLPPRAARTSSASELIPPASLARQIAFTYPASDGMRLHGFVTVPPGLDMAQLPLVANVHGGPWNHVRPGHVSITQLLANRGYAVFEPNFRGSTGHGRDYLLAARGDYGNGRVQQDIIDGIEYLLAHGVGAAQRVGIVGASFGGYSTLLGVTFRPDLFRIGVAVVPPPDFAVNLRWVARSSESLELANHTSFESVLRLLSLDLADSTAMARLGSQSPLANASRVQRPVVLIAGGADRRVAISSVIEYASRLKLLGKDVSLLVDPDGAHSNSDPVAREASLYLLEAALAEHLGGKPAAAPDELLRRYLDRHLRIRGKHLHESYSRSQPTRAQRVPAAE